MRYALTAITIAILLICGEWVYRTFARPIDSPTEEMIRLGQHLEKSGLLARFYPVRHGFRHSQVLATGAYELKNYPLPVSVSACPTEAVAEAHRLAVAGSPNLMNPVRLGTLVIYFPMWGDDTQEMMSRVTNSLSSFESAQ